MSDLIDRQEAIAAVGYYSLHSGDKLLFADKPLKELPSAQQDCSDCIKHGGDWDCDHVHCHKGESAQPEQRWIPCSERLPEDLEEVNVTWVNHNPEPYYNFVKDKPFTATAVYYKEKWYWYSATCADFLAEYGGNWYEEIDDGIEIIAWMPLPEPYAERRTDERQGHRIQTGGD